MKIYVNKRKRKNHKVKKDYCEIIKRKTNKNKINIKQKIKK